MRKRNDRKTNLLPMIVGCSGAGISTGATPITADATLTVILETRDGQHYLLPLSELGADALLQVFSHWRLTRDFLSDRAPPKTSPLQ